MIFLVVQMVPTASGTQFQRVQIPGQEFLEEEPLYVNAKQYKRILKRRQARAKLEAEGKIPKERPVSLDHDQLYVLSICDLCRNTSMNHAIGMR